MMDRILIDRLQILHLLGSHDHVSMDSDDPTIGSHDGYDLLRQGDKHLKYPITRNLL